MKSICLTICVLTCLISTSVSGQEKGKIRENAEPAFFRSYANYIRANGQRRIEGYRIQIYNGQRGEANQWRSRFMQLFPNMENEVIYETPDYKFQVGNYRTIYEAEAALTEVRMEFSGAFIVQTGIDPPALHIVRQTPNPLPPELQEEYLRPESIRMEQKDSSDFRGSLHRR